MSVVISAPGKIHLLGEHAVVYGYPSLLASVDRRIYVQVKSQKSCLAGRQAKVKSLDARAGKNQKDIIIINTFKDDKLIKSAISVFVKAFKIKKMPPLQIDVKSQIPAGCGMGSSAAVSAAVVGALMKLLKNVWNPVKINELAYSVEKIAHGNPSGADNTAVVFGGLVWYRREFEFLKSIWSLPVVSYNIPKFAVINSGKPIETTKEMVNFVRNNYKKRKKYTEELFLSQEKQAKKLLLALKEGDNTNLKQAISKGEENLEKIGVVGKKAGEIIKFVARLGGCAKICGAGGVKKGSGIILCFHENLLKLKPVENKFGIKLENIQLAGDGVRIEQIWQ